MGTTSKWSDGKQTFVLDLIVPLLTNHKMTIHPPSPLWRFCPAPAIWQETHHKSTIIVARDCIPVARPAERKVW